MIESSLQERLDQYIENYDMLKKALRWKLSYQQAVMLVASMYAVHDKPLDVERYLTLCETMRKQAGMFSSLRSHLRFPLSASLDVRFTEPEKKLSRLEETYQQLVAEGFKKTAYTYICALVLTNEEGEGRDPSQVIARALEIYRGMKAKHRFLTSSDDYPLAVLLALRDIPFDTLMDRIGWYYEAMRSQGFKRGQHLQFMSHIVALDHGVERELIVERAVRYVRMLKEQDVKVKTMHYPVIAMLAMLPEEQGREAASTMATIVHRLHADKRFRWVKEMNLIVASTLVLREHASQGTVLQTGLQTAIEALIQAQQAAMIAALAASAAAASSSNGGG